MDKCRPRTGCNPDKYPLQKKRERETETHNGSRESGSRVDLRRCFRSERVAVELTYGPNFFFWVPGPNSNPSLSMAVQE